MSPNSNIIILDDQSEIVLYGRILIEVIASTRRAQPVKIYRLPAEAWIALLQTYYTHLPEVRRYLAAVEQDGGINPEEGKLLKAVDEIIEISEEQADWLHRFVLAHPE